VPAALTAAVRFAVAARADALTTRCWRSCSARWAAQLRELVLWLQAACLTGGGAVEAMAPAVRCLKRLEFAGRYNLQELGAAGDVRLFPRLRRLRLKGACMEVYKGTNNAYGEFISTFSTYCTPISFFKFLYFLFMLRLACFSLCG
jgi:hypothetical protein